MVNVTPVEPHEEWRQYLGPRPPRPPMGEVREIPGPPLRSFEEMERINSEAQAKLVAEVSRLLCNHAETPSHWMAL